jgi:hypothetical protein
VYDWFLKGRFMKEDQHRFLMVAGQLPVRLNAEQTAWILNCQPHDIPVLVTARLLKPLGNPPPNAIKFYGTAEVLELTKERTWLAKVTNAINQHWRDHNAGRESRSKIHPENGQPVVLNAIQPLASTSLN